MTVSVVLADMADSTGLAVVTGSSSGIGRATAQAFARRGYRTVLIARRLELLQALAADLSRHAPSVPLALDMSCEAAVDRELSRLADRHGPVDVLVNCAGQGMYQPFLDGDGAHVRGMMHTHFFGPVAAIRALLPSMLARGEGHIINIGSMSVKMGPWGHGSYAAAKAALTALTQSLSAEYGGHGVRFSVVHPGLVDTPYFQLPALAPLREQTRRWLIRPERVARRVTRLVERPRLEVCVPGNYRVVDAIGAVSPRLLHQLVAWQSAPRARFPPGPAHGPGQGRLPGREGERSDE